MYISIIRNDYDNFTDTLEDYKKNCTNNENNTEIIIPALLFARPCFLLFLCLMSLMVYTLIKHLFIK